MTPATTFEEVRRRLEAHVPVEIGSEEAPRRAAVAAIFRQAEGPVPFELLFILRSSRADDPWSGQMAFPGGHRESGDRTLLSTAIRETREEIGLDLEHDAELLGRIDDVRASVRGKLLPMSITPFAFRLENRSVRTVASDEAQEVLWIPAPLLVDPATGRILPGMGSPRPPVSIDHWHAGLCHRGGCRRVRTSRRR